MLTRTIALSSRSAGHLPTKCANLRFLPENGGRMPVTQIFRFVKTKEATGPDTRDYSSVRPGMDLIWQIMGKTNSAVNLNPGMCPSELEQSFQQAGETFHRDFSTLSNLIFVPTVCLQENGKSIWSPGFTLGQLNLPTDQEAALLGDLRYIGEPKQMAFLSCFTADGRAIVPEHLHWSLSFLIGQIKLDALMIARGLTSEKVGRTARECFAQTYQLDMVQGLLATLGKQPGFAGSQMDVKYQRFISMTEQVISGYYQRMTPFEINLVTNLKTSA